MFKDDLELFAYLDYCRFNAEATRDSYLIENEEGLLYYQGQKPEQQAVGGSKWVDRTVYDQHRGLSAQLGDTFANADSVVRYSTNNPRHQMAAKIATKHVNEQILQKNDGYVLIRKAIQACLLEKAAYLMPYWREVKLTEKIDVEGLAPESVEVLAANPSVISFDLKEDDDGVISGSYTVETDESHLAIDLVPFEAVCFEDNARSIHEANYVVRKINKMRGVFLAEGIEVSDDAFYVDDNEQLMMSIRNRNLLQLTGYSTDAQDPSREFVSVFEHFILSTIDGEFGWWKVVADSIHIISKERVKGIPFAMLTPLPNPFTIYGDSIPDITKDIQALRTFTFRGLIDAVQYANHPRYLTLKGAYDKQQLENKKPNGTVDVDTLDAVSLLPVPPVTNEISTLAQLATQAANTRTGLSDAAQGLNDAVFQNDNAYATVQTVMSQALQRTKEVAFNLAYGGITDFMRICYEVIRENDTNTYQTSIEGTPVTYQPSQWPAVIDIRVDATISPTDKVAHTSALRAFKTELASLPAVAELKLSGPQQQFNYAYKLGKALNLTEGDISDLIMPLSQGTQPQPDPMNQLNVQKVQAEIQLISATAQKEAASAQKTAADVQVAQDKFLFEQQKQSQSDLREDARLQFEQNKAADEITIKRDGLALEREKIEADIMLTIDHERNIGL